jgi:hypothetical protein
MGSCSKNRIVAKRIKNGTNAANTAGGVRLSRAAPRIPPIKLGIINTKKRRGVSSSSLRYPHMLLHVPGTSATVLVALAMIGECPAQMSEGKVSSVPPPATALIIPAAIAEPKSNEPWRKVMGIKGALEAPTTVIGEATRCGLRNH